MTVNFKAFKTEAGVEQFLASHLTIGAASPDDVSAFLRDLGLEPSALDKNAGLPSDVTLSTFDAMIVCAASARSTLLILQNDWSLMFLFSDGKLVRIVVQKYRVGFWLPL